MNIIDRLKNNHRFRLIIESTTHGTEVSVISTSSSEQHSFELVLGVNAFTEAIYWLFLNGHIDLSQPITTKVEIDSYDKTILLVLKSRLIGHLLNTHLTQIP